MRELFVVYALYCSPEGYIPPEMINRYISYQACIDGAMKDKKATRPRMKCICNREKIDGK
jgi:hypothetical protein